MPRFGTGWIEIGSAGGADLGQERGPALLDGLDLFSWRRPARLLELRHLLRGVIRVHHFLSSRQTGGNRLGRLDNQLPGPLPRRQALVDQVADGGGDALQLRDPVVQRLTLHAERGDQIEIVPVQQLANPFQREP